jgi:hypothetical protein
MALSVGFVDRFSRRVAECSHGQMTQPGGCVAVVAVSRRPLWADTDSVDDGARGRHGHWQKRRRHARGGRTESF